jgi:hypothetical protein
MKTLPLLLLLTSSTMAPVYAQTCGINGATPGMIGGCLTSPSYGQPTYRLQTSPVNPGVIQVVPGYGLQPIRPTPYDTVPQITPIWRQ